MARFPFLTQVMLILLYIMFTVWIYLAYTGSFRFRIPLFHGPLLNHDPTMNHGLLEQQQTTMVNSNVDVPQMVPKMTQKPAGNEDETKKDHRTRKNPIMEGFKPHSDLTPNGLMKTAEETPRHTSSYNDLKYLKNCSMTTAATASQKHLVQKTKTKPVETKPKDGFLYKSQFNQTNPEANNTLWNISTPKRPRSRVQDKLTPLSVLYKKDFKKMPNWETNDVYLWSNEPIQRSCAESLHKTKDVAFRTAFMPSIQLYLYQGLLNQSEWNRLAHFNNPFGFMEYNYSDIKNVVDVIPKPGVARLLPVPENDTCVCCAVVANGGILHGSRMGQEIDAHHYVFRMNGAVTGGHEEDVGHRTSVYVHTAYSLITSLRIFKKFGFNKIPSDEGIKHVMIPEGLRDFLWLQGLLTRQEVTKGEFQKIKPWMYYEGLDQSRFYVLHPDFLRYVRNRFLTSKQQDGKHWALYRPTNGAFSLFLALHVCDTVDAYGFITEDHRKYSNYYFEKDQKTKVIFFINHDYNLEIKTWRKLHNAKIIRLYQREEGER